MTARPTVGIDIDEPLFPWYQVAHLRCLEADITNGVKPSTWAPYEDYGCTREEWVTAVEAMISRGDYTAVPPHEGAVEALGRLAEHADIHLVTSRGAFPGGHTIRADTAIWAQRFEVPHVGLHFTQSKGMVRVDYAIDDHERHVREWSAAGTKVALLAMPYNQHVNHPFVHDIGEFVAKTLKEIHHG